MLDAAASKYLSGRAVRQQLTLASIAYQLKHPQLGECGRIVLRKLAESATEISIDEPAPSIAFMHGSAALKRLVDDYRRGMELPTSARMKPE